jgi:hypothetical protein
VVKLSPIPNVVPITENNDVYVKRLTVAPLQINQPGGDIAKVYAVILPIGGAIGT